MRPHLALPKPAPVDDLSEPPLPPEPPFDPGPSDADLDDTDLTPLDQAGADQERFDPTFPRDEDLDDALPPLDDPGEESTAAPPPPADEADEWPDPEPAPPAPADPIELPWQLHARLPDLGVEVPAVLEPGRARTEWVLPEPPDRPVVRLRIGLGALEVVTDVQIARGEPAVLRVGRDLLEGRVRIRC